MAGSVGKYNKEEWLGKKYGNLTIIGFEHYFTSKTSSWYWRMKCDCGKEIVVSPSKAIDGKTVSCGCKKVERCHELTKKYRIKHGGRNERLYAIWHGMKQRCYCEAAKDYANYGGRGIVICDEWKNNYELFRNWAAANGYSEKLSIDRIDPNGNYEPKNCRWVSMRMQAQNQRRSHNYEYCGEVRNLAEIAELSGVKYVTLYKRVVCKGKTIDEATKKAR